MIRLMIRLMFSQADLQETLRELHQRGVSDSRLARICQVDRRMIPRWREGQNTPRDLDRVFLALKGVLVTLDNGMWEELFGNPPPTKEAQPAPQQPDVWEGWEGFMRKP